MTNDEMTSLQAPSPYVEAKTEEEAMKKLDQIDRERSGGVSVSTTGVNFGPCVLYPAGFHLRKSSGYKYGGVKPVTVCTKHVTGIKMASQLRVKNLLMWVKTGAQIPQTATDHDLKTGGVYKKKHYTVKFEQKNMNYKCNGKKSHKWSADIIGRLRYQGHTMWARVAAPVLTFACGPH
ncbi:hypothetical protein [Brevibacterium sp.]|uniref:hypothetical protein n=1 Tax=Brevibacterium sp. TaxID=1701 RepID=UPI0028125BC0|nr:hypothetical protein [Brevibacterium sp.]